MHTITTSSVSNESGGGRGRGRMAAYSDPDNKNTGNMAWTKYPFWYVHKILANLLIWHHIVYWNITTGPGTNSISETDDDDLNDSDLDDDDEDVDVDGIDEQDPEGVEHEIIDIREPLINLKRKLEVKLEIDLTHYDFYLQGTQIGHLK